MGEDNKSALMTPAEAAQAFRVDTKTLNRWADAGKLSFTRTMGGHRRYFRAEIDTLLAAERLNVNGEGPG